MDYRDKNFMSASVGGVESTYDEGLRSFMLGVYNYMASALALTGVFAYLAANYPPVMNALYAQTANGHLTHTALGTLVMFAPIAFILILNFGINKLSTIAAQGVFWGFAAVMGLSVSSIFFAYTGESIMRVFFITAIMFGSVSMWGYATKRDLTGMGHFMMMGLFGIIIASIANIWVGSSALQFGVSILGVVIFTGLTAYDTQKMKSIYYQVSGSADLAGKYAIMGAVNLYLDFLNLFMFLLSFFGDRK